MIGASSPHAVPLSTKISVRRKLRETLFNPATLRAIIDSRVTRPTPRGLKLAGLQPSASRRSAAPNPAKTPAPNGSRPPLTFTHAAATLSSLPPLTTTGKTSRAPEIVFIGRSNCGKSSLLNALTQSTTVRVRNIPGFTKTVNFFAYGKQLVLVDTPGYGFGFGREHDDGKTEGLVRDVVHARKGRIKLLCVCLDARQGVKQDDLRFIRSLEPVPAPVMVVLTKADLVKDVELAKRHAMVSSELSLDEKNVFCVSSTWRRGTEAVLKYLAWRLRRKVV